MREKKRAKHTARWMFECIGKEFVVTRDVFMSAKPRRIEEIREVAGREEFDTIGWEASGCRA